MYGVEWLIGLSVLWLLLGLGGGYLLSGRLGLGSAARVRELEQELDAAHRELTDYRQQVVSQFSETARKFQTLNDSYTDLHQQLARSSSILCGDVSGPLLAAPASHQDLLPRAVREGDPEADGRAQTQAAEPSPPEAEPPAPEAQPAPAEAEPARAEDPAPGDIRVSEPQRPMAPPMERAESELPPADPPEGSPEAGDEMVEDRRRAQRG